MIHSTKSLLTAVKKILRDVRFGNLSNRLIATNFPNDVEFVNDFNNMLEAIEDREAVVKEYHNFYNSTTEHMKALFNMLNDGAMTLDEDLTILSLNDIQSKWFHKTRKNLIGKNLACLLKSYKIFDYAVNKPINSYMEFFKKDRKNFLLCFELKKLKSFFSVSVKKFIADNDKINYFIISKDVSSDMKLQKLKNTFIATLTHDLKVPIIAEAKVLNLLSNEVFGKNSKEQQEAIDNMSLNNKEMMELVSTLLDVYKLEEGAFQITKTTFNIEELIIDITEKLKFLMQDNLLKFDLNFDNNKSINADKREIGRVLNNIIHNAINFAPQNSKIIITTQKEDDYICVSITDFGKGIEPEKIPLIFERYYTSDKKYRKVGTGLGLYLSKKILELHGGAISVESIPQVKTTFKIKLPIIIL